MDNLSYTQHIQKTLIKNANKKLPFFEASVLSFLPSLGLAIISPSSIDKSLLSLHLVYKLYIKDTTWTF